CPVLVRMKGGSLSIGTLGVSHISTPPMWRADSTQLDGARHRIGPKSYCEIFSEGWAVSREPRERTELLQTYGLTCGTYTPAPGTVTIQSIPLPVRIFPPSLRESIPFIAKTLKWCRTGGSTSRSMSLW